LKVRLRLSPGHLVAFVCFAAVCVLCAGAGRAARVASAQAPPAQRFNGLVAFTTNRNGVSGESYTMNPDGTAPTNLTNADSLDMDPSWQSLSAPFVEPSPTPTQTATPTATPTPSDFGDESWEPYVPPAEQITLDVLGCVRAARSSRASPSSPVHRPRSRLTTLRSTSGSTTATSSGATRTKAATTSGRST
jgi:hypothetical protein